VEVLARDPILDDLLEGTRAPEAGGVTGSSSPLPRASVPYRPQAIQKINYSHDGMINLIIANRGISQNALAAHFGYSASWISQVMSSDAFQARLLERAGEIEDPTLRATVEESLKGLVSRSMEILKRKLDEPDVTKIPDNLAIRTLELSTRALGYGAREQTVAVQVNVENHLENLGGRLVSLLQRKKVEVETPADLICKDIEESV
jgi:transcriptional regulator with XRE-family HTH domain